MDVSDIMYLHHRSLDKLQEQVAKAIKDGYQPYGKLVVNKTAWLYIQPVIKKREENQ